MLPEGKPRLLVLSSTYPRWAGDPEPGFVHELNKRLVSHFDVVALVPSAPGAKSSENLDGVEIVRFRYAPSRLEVLVNNGGIISNLRAAPWKYMLVPFFLLAMSWAYLRAIRRYKPAVVHAHWLIPQGLVASALSSATRSAPYVVTSHGADLFALRGGVMRRLKRLVFSRAASATVVSTSMLAPAKAQGAAAERLSVQPMGVDFSQRFVPPLGRTRDSESLLFVGRLVEKKGVRVLLDALVVVRQARSNVALTIVGSGPEEEALRQRVRQLGLSDCVQFVGAVSQQDLPLLYQSATLLVAPFVEATSGDQEGLGLVVIEALGCGCPVLVADLPGTRDVVLPPICRAPSGNAHALASRIIEILGLPESERLKLASVPREAVIKQFDWASVAHRYVEILSDATGRGSDWLTLHGKATKHED